VGPSPVPCGIWQMPNFSHFCVKHIYCF